MGVATYSPPAERVGEELVYPDGRHELADDRTIRESPLYNADLAPVPIKRRTWTTYNYMALWIGMAHNIPTYLLASGLVALGMAWYQAILTIALANIIVLIPMLANSHAGTKYGIPYPVFARASFGVFGANVAALLRAGVACGWFGIQTWIGGGALYALSGKLFGSGWTNSAMVAGQHWTLWLSFAVFWVLNIFIILRGMDAVRRFENWAAPFVLIVALGLLAWMVTKAGGFGPILSQPGKVGWGSNFWFLLFPPALMGMIASATQKVYGAPIWDPVALTAKFDNPLVVIFALFTLAVATLSVNVAANIVSPSYDFSNVIPKLISFRTGGLITGVLGIAIQPWNLLANPNVYIFTWLGFYGGALGAIAGVLIADYWVMRSTLLKLGDLYRVNGEYRYSAGFNWRGLVSLVVGGVLAVGGAYSTPGNGPFPKGGIIGPLYSWFPFHVYDYSWVVGLVAAFLCYLVLAAAFPAGAVRRTPQAAAAT
ncbi:MAG: NCS1 family nucleobase:cation symporter-1 [Chloroflexi bacterium]|nr:MAG: NCS1 family nucleobase:cation symporter-1 [Chloroflexota bacterium]